MAKALKKRASKKPYTSPRQLTFVNFESPFTRHLPSTNRWVQLAASIPWDDIVGVYRTQLNNFSTGASNINPRVAIGALMVKHLLNISDRDTIIAIQENIFIQHFLGFDSFVYEEPFNASLFVEIRKRLGMEYVEQINDLIFKHSQKQSVHQKESSHKNDITDTDIDSKDESSSNVGAEDTKSKIETESPITHSGKLLIDATACPQDITYPTDLKLLNASREKSEEIIDKLYDPSVHVFKKPRTYREEARKRYLLVSKKKVRRRSEVRKALGQQLRYLRRNLSSIVKLLRGYETTPLSARDAKYLDTIKMVYAQQVEMYRKRSHSVEDRIVNIHQPYVRPIVRGKEKAKVEFGSKINVSLINGYSFIDHFSWDAFNEGSHLKESIYKYKIRHGYYPAEVSVDQIYCTRSNRKMLNDLNIKLIGRKLGRPPKSGKEKLDPGDRNPIEGKFGQGKTRYGLGLIKARLQGTSETWVSLIMLVLNLVRMAKDRALLIFVMILEALEGIKLEFSRAISRFWQNRYTPQMAVSLTY